MKNYPTEAQIQMLREGLQGHHLESMLLLALDLGLRRDELRHLTWAEVDLEKGEISVLNSKKKSHVRCMNLPENVAHALSKHALCQKERNRNADTTKRYPDLVFPDGVGEELSTQRFLQEWSAVCEQVGLPYLCFHNLRILWCREKLGV
ncbi:hypothetical protein KDW_07420 [Dictyobacter vulcani]|uniref:Tyr recombinase domain-containing protein n=1 Tax=Dictyobacter vulcani TaxID=2607529 RepID=A0A5J4KJP6_9CHLR|nr:tyrosine-type recombinase/integrase [Dictyobacter vulcani]GER86580.1 hypothetical protein KDW_07420 [Dictyobacter vulcani]